MKATTLFQKDYPGSSRSYRQDKRLITSPKTIVLMALIGLSAINLPTGQSITFQQMQNRFLEGTSGRNLQGTHRSIVTRQGYEEYKATWNQILQDMEPLFGDDLPPDFTPIPDEDVVIPTPNPTTVEPSETTAAPAETTVPPTAAPTDIVVEPTLEPQPTITIEPFPSPTDTPPSETEAPEPTVTIEPQPTVTEAPAPTDTEAPAPTDTEAPAPTDTQAPTIPDVPTAAPTDTEAPAPTDTEAPAPTDTEAPAPTYTEAPAPTIPDTPPVTEAPLPTETQAPAPTPSDSEATQEPIIPVIPPTAAPVTIAPAPIIPDDKDHTPVIPPTAVPNTDAPHPTDEDIIPVIPPTAAPVPTKVPHPTGTDEDDFIPVVPPIPPSETTIACETTPPCEVKPTDAPEVIPTPPDGSDSEHTNGEQEKPLGCLVVDEYNECQQCNQYSWLDSSDNSCNCVFNYKVEIEKYCDEDAHSDAEMQYQLSVYTHLDLGQEVYEMSNAGELSCEDLLLFIFADQATLDALAEQVDLATCEINKIFYIIPPTGNDSYSNILHIRNLTQEVFDAFIRGNLEIAYDYFYITLECYGAPDFLVTYQGIECGPEQQSYCQYQNQTIPDDGEDVNVTPPIDEYENEEYENYEVIDEEEDINLGADGDSNDCQDVYELSLASADNVTWSLNITNLPLRFAGEFIDAATQQVRCSDIIFASQNLSTVDQVNVEYSALLTCFAYQPVESSDNASGDANGGDAAAEDDGSAANTDDNSNSSVEPTPEPSPVPDQANNNDTATPDATPAAEETAEETANDENVDNLGNVEVESLVLSIQNMTKADAEAFANQLYVLFLNLTNYQQTENSTCTLNASEPFAIQGSSDLIPPQCDENCDLCDDESQTCDRCKSGYILVTINADSNKCEQNPCTDDQLYNAETKECSPKCEEGCAVCNTQGQCLECAVDYLKLYSDYSRRRGAAVPQTSFRCVKQCPVDFFTDFRGKQCSLCDPDCPQCEQSMFYRCPFDASLFASCDNKRQVSIGGQSINRQVGQINCQRRCPDGFYGFDGWCHKCSSSCANCLSYNQCLSCPAYSKLENQTCVQQVCDAGSFLNRQGDCQSCSSNCSECSGNANNCTACGEGFSLSDGQCVEGLGESIICNVGFYANESTSSCQKCPGNCYACNSASDCTQCSPFSFKLVNENNNQTSCVGGCPTGWYGRNSDRQCVKCSVANCAFCAPQSQCWSCQDGYYRSRYTCFDSCPRGQYIGQDFLKYYQCQTCPSQCLDCSSRDTCSECAPGYVKVTSQYNDISEATVQRAVKASCVRQGSSCPVGTWFNATSNACVLCSRGCAQCNSQGQCTQQCDLSTQSRCQDCLARPTECIQCKAGEVLIRGEGGQPSRCQASCNQTGQFYDNKTQTCQPCLANCDKCSDSNTCQQCSSGNFYFEMEGNNQCLAQCPVRHYASQSNQQCMKCSKNCLNCTQSSRCDVCDSTTQLDQVSGRCFCALKYTAFLDTNEQNVQVKLENVEWDSSVIQYFMNYYDTPFNCSAVFDFYQLNQTSQSNANTTNDVLDDFDKLQCTAGFGVGGNIAFVTIYNVSQIMQSLIRNQLVNIGLVKGAYKVSCVQYVPPLFDILSGSQDYNIKRDVGTGRRLQLSEIQSGELSLYEEDIREIDNALQEQGDQLKQLIDQNENEDRFYQDLIRSQEKQQQDHDEKMHMTVRHLNVIVFVLFVFVIIGVLIARKAMQNKKMRLVVYERQVSELEDDNSKVIEMSKINQENQDKHENVELLE